MGPKSFWGVQETGPWISTSKGSVYLKSSHVVFVLQKDHCGKVVTYLLLVYFVLFCSMAT